MICRGSEILGRRNIFLIFLIPSLFALYSQVAAQEQSRNRDLFFANGPWSFGFGIPVSYTFKEAKDNGSLESSGLPAGIMLFLKSPFYLGLGFEYYKIRLENEFDQSGALNKLTSTMIDLDVSLDLDFLFITLGGGFGYSWIEGDNAGLVNPTSSSQLFFKTGFNMTDHFKVYLTLHDVTAQIELKKSDSLLEAGGLMISTGIITGF